MKRNLLRILSLSAVAGLALFSTAPGAGAADGECHLRCSSGYSWDGYAGNCCQLFGTWCGWSGMAWEEQNGFEVYCPSID